MPTYTERRRAAVERREKILDLWASDVPTPEIAIQFGMTTDQVRRCVSHAREQDGDPRARCREVHDKPERALHPVEQDIRFKQAMLAALKSGAERVVVGVVRAR